MADFTSSVYSLVVLASATLGISQYFQGTQKSVFDELKKKVKHTLEDEGKELFDNHFDKPQIQKLKEDGDDLSNQTFPHMKWTMGGLFCVLPSAGILQILNIGAKAWGWENHWSFLSDFLVYLFGDRLASFLSGSLIPFALYILYAWTIFWVVCIAGVLVKNRYERVKYERSANQFCSAVLTANAVK